MTQIISSEYEFDRILDKGNLLDSMRTQEFQNVLDRRTRRVCREIEYLLDKYPDYPDVNRTNLLGDLGEYFFDNFEWVMYDREYSGICDGVRSYKVYKNVGAKKYSPRGGIDRKILITDDIHNVYPIAVEIKNWYNYDYKDKSYYKKYIEDDILPRYEYADEEDFKVLVIPKKLVEPTRMYIPDNIYILPLEHHITPELSEDGIRYSLRQFYLEFDRLLQQTVYSREAVIRRLYKRNKITQEEIAEDYGISQQTVSSIVNREVVMEE
jgi:hypothetical protein